MNKLVFPFIRTSLIFLIYFLVSLNESNGQTKINNFYLSNPYEVVIFEHCDSANCYYDTITYDERGIIKSVTSMNKQTNAIVREEFICVQFQTHYIIASNEEKQKLTAIHFDSDNHPILFVSCSSPPERHHTKQKTLEANLEKKIREDGLNYSNSYSILCLNDNIYLAGGYIDTQYQKKETFLKRKISARNFLLTSKDFANHELKETQINLLLISLEDHCNTGKLNKIKFYETLIIGNYWQKENVVLQTQQIIFSVPDSFSLSSFLSPRFLDENSYKREIVRKISNNDFEVKFDRLVLKDTELQYLYYPRLSPFYQERSESDSLIYYSARSFCKGTFMDLYPYPHISKNIVLSPKSLTYKRLNEYRTLKTVTSKNKNWKYKNLQKAKNLFYISSTLIHLHNG